MGVLVCGIQLHPPKVLESLGTSSLFPRLPGLIREEIPYSLNGFALAVMTARFAFSTVVAATLHTALAEDRGDDMAY